MTIRQYRIMNHAFQASCVVDACELAERQWFSPSQHIGAATPGGMPSKNDFEQFKEDFVIGFYPSSMTYGDETLCRQDALNLMTITRTETLRKFRRLLKSPVATWLWSQDDVRKAWRLASGTDDRGDADNAAEWSSLRLICSEAFNTIMRQQTEHFSASWILRKL